MRKLCGVLAACVLAPIALAGPLPPGTAQYKDLIPGASYSPDYTLGFPPVGALVDSLSSPITLGFFHGTVESYVYANGHGALTFVYRILLDPVTQPILDRASLSGSWGGVTIFDTGSDSSGSSGAIGGAATTWTDGDPFQIERGAAGSPAVEFANPIDGSPNGTFMGPGHTSAYFWFETDAPSYTRATIGLLDHGAVGLADILGPAAIPAPAAVLLGLLGLGVTPRLARRRA